MKALTLWQPWATLIIAKAKPLEFRGWPCPASVVGQRIGIHAGARQVKVSEIVDLLKRLETGNSEGWSSGLVPELAIPILERALRDPNSLWRAAMLGTAVVGKPIRDSELAERMGKTLVNDSDREEHSNWGWPMTDVEGFEPPIPARGMQGLWEWRP